jgi:CubicO group peptidase (beta-lactamase class C family)
MTTSWQSSVQPTIEAIVRDHSLPGMIVALAHAGGPVEHLVIGTDAAGTPLTPDALVPVASVTKLTTALAVLRLVDARVLELDDPLARHLPDAAAAAEGVTLRTLLCHTAGLPGDVAPEAAPYNRQLDWPVLVRATLATPLVRPPRTSVEYSNLGPGLLAIIIERLLGKPIPEALSELVLQPLGIEGYLGAEPSRPAARIRGALGEHAGTDLEPYNSPFWHSLGLPWGGLVTTADGALALVRAFAGVPAGFLSPAILAEATSDQTGGLSGSFVGVFAWPRASWGLGVELRGDKTPHLLPVSASPASFGHAGHSGCIAWHDPDVQLAWFFHGLCTIESWHQRQPEISAAILGASGIETGRGDGTASPGA